MDPLSIIASATTLASAALEISVQIKALARSPLKIAKLSRDLQQFREELDILKRNARHPRFRPAFQDGEPYLISLLSNAQKHLDDLSLTLNTVTSKDGRDVEGNRLALFLCERKCRGHHLQLSDSLVKLRRLQQLHYISAAFEFSVGENPEISRLCLEQPEESESAESATPRESLSISLAPSETLDGEEHSLIPANLRSEVAVLDPVLDSAHCTCQCHSEAHSLFRHRLESRLPSIFSRNTTRCTNFHCCVRDRAPRGKVIVPPSWIRRTSVASLRKKSTRVEISIPYRPVIPEGSDANRYAKIGNVEGLRYMLAHGLVVPSATTPDGWTLLHGAVYNAQLGTAKLLYNEHADLSATEDGLRTAADLARVRALVIGATKEQIEIASLFTGAEDFKDDYELTAVHIAALGLYEHEDAVRPDLAAVLDFIDDADNAPVNTEWKKFRVEDKRSSPLYGSIVETYADWGQGRRLRNERLPIIDTPDRKHGWTPLFWAAFTGRKDALEILISSGADPFTFSEKKRNALHLAAESKDPGIMSYILGRPSFRGKWFDIDHQDYWGETPLHVAAYGSADCVNLLLDRGACRSTFQETKQVPLHYASLVSNKDEKFRIVDFLSADRGIHINHRDEEGRSPIFDLLDSPACIELLIARGADPSLVDNRERTVFHHAAIENAAASLAILLEHDPRSSGTSLDNEQNTPLSLAFQHESTSAIIELVKHDAIGKLHHRDNWALVHYAAFLGDGDVLEVVLNHRSFVRGQETSKGESAADIAKAAGKWKGKAKDLLKAYDSKGQSMAASSEQIADQTMARAAYMMYR